MDRIINPANNKYYSIFNNKGKNILKSYVKHLIGGSKSKPKSKSVPDWKKQEDNVNAIKILQLAQLGGPKISKEKAKEILESVEYNFQLALDKLWS